MHALSTGVVLLVSAGVWEVLHASAFLQGRWPSLLAVLRQFADAGFLEDAGEGVLNTLWLVSRGLLIGLALGGGTGAVLGIGGRKAAGGYHALNALRAVPVTVLIPVFLGMFGLQSFLVPLVALPVASIMGANLAQAIQEAAQPRRRMLSLYGFGPRAYLRHVLPWETADALFATLRTVVPFSLAIEVAVDYFMNANQGIGAVIYRNYQYPGNEPAMFACILLVAFLGIGSVSLIDWLGRWVLEWKQADT